MKRPLVYQTKILAGISKSAAHAIESVGTHPRLFSVMMSRGAGLPEPRQ
jgi:hypothetical protein